MTRLTYVLVAASFVALAACGGAKGAEGADLTKYEGPIRSTDMAAGEAAWGKVCAACHAAEDGTMQGVGTGHPVAVVRHQIREGGEKMPPVSEKRLSDEDMESLLAFLESKGVVGPAADAAGAAGTVPTGTEGTPEGTPAVE